jgi:CheY-like chemotaxis protein
MEAYMNPVATQTESSSTMQRALIVGAGPEALLGIQSMLGADRFRVLFLDKDETPYIAVRQRRPDLVVLCFAPDDDEACQVLQMLQLDPATRRMPILTYVNGEAYAIIPTKWPRTKSGIPSASNSWGPYTAR